MDCRCFDKPWNTGRPSSNNVPIIYLSYLLKGKQIFSLSHSGPFASKNFHCVFFLDFYISGNETQVFVYTTQVFSQWAASPGLDSSFSINF